VPQLEQKLSLGKNKRLIIVLPHESQKLMLRIFKKVISPIPATQMSQATKSSPDVIPKIANKLPIKMKYQE